VVTTITKNLESTFSARWNEFLFDSNLKSKQVMSSGLEFVVTSGDHHYDGTRHFTSSIPGAKNLRDAPLSGAVPDQMSEGPIQITENGSVALIPLLKAAGLEIPQLPTDPDLRLRTLYAVWMAVLGILSKKGRAGLEAKNRSIEVPRIVQINPETLAKFRSLRVEVVGGRAVRVPTGRYTSATSDDQTQGEPESSRPTLHNFDHSLSAEYARRPAETIQGPPLLGTIPSGGESLRPPMTAFSANSNLPVFVEQPFSAFTGQLKSDYEEVKWDPALSMPNPHSTIDVGSVTSVGLFPQNSGVMVVDPPISTIHGRGTVIGPPPGFRPVYGEMTVGRENNNHHSHRIDTLSRSEKRGHETHGVPSSHRESSGSAGPPYRILQRKKPEDELKNSGTGSLISDPVSLYQGPQGPSPAALEKSRVFVEQPLGTPRYTGWSQIQSREGRTGITGLMESQMTVRSANISHHAQQGETDLLLQGDRLQSAKVNERVDAVDPRPMSDTQLQKQILEYIKSQSSGQLEGRAIGAVAKNIYNSYREVAVQKSRDPNLLDRIEKAILELGQSEQIQLGINGKRFPIQIPSNLPQLRHRFSIPDLQQIYREHRDGLAHVNSFSAAARILANSSNRWKHMDRGVAEQLAAAAVAQLIENNLFW